MELFLIYTTVTAFRYRPVYGKGDIIGKPKGIGKDPCSVILDDLFFFLLFLAYQGEFLIAIATDSQAVKAPGTLATRTSHSWKLRQLPF